MSRQKPLRLHKGKEIQVISPASSPKNRQSCQQGLQFLSEKGYQVVTGKYIYEKYDYLAGEDKKRAEDCENALKAKSQAVLCTRGGYGCARLTPFLESLSFQPEIRTLMGYSDLTTLLWYAYTRWEWVTYYGPMVAVEMGENSFINSFTEKWFSLFTEKNPENIIVPHLPYQEMECLIPGKAEGELLGGCLSIFTPILGTSFCPDFTGKILFFEEVGEPVYKVDRMLMHLANAGVFQKVKGIIIGEMIDCEKKEDQIRLKDIFYQILSPYNIPVVMHAPFGHGKEKCIFPIGIRAYIDAANTEIRFLEKLWEDN